MMKISDKHNKSFFSAIFFLFVANLSFGQVPKATTDIMLQGFAWDSHGETKWNALNTQADELGTYFDMIWLPPSAAGETGGSKDMGYHPKQWSNQNSSWGTKSELKTLIQSLHEKDCKVLADIIVNHRAGTGWVTFPKDDYGEGYTAYQFNASHICKDDEANSSGYPTTGNNDFNWNVSGDKWGGYAAARDLDHTNEYVRSAVKEYMRFLKEDIGYDGWRYDLVKGYHPQYTKEYNEAAKAYFSVGEYYQANYNDLRNWVAGTDYSSTVFDFYVKNRIKTWNGGANYSLLREYDNGVARPTGLIRSSEMRQYAVTFVDNHDTAPPHDGSWPYTGDISKAYAFLLSSPGIPCVFWPHWKTNKYDIQQMIVVRKAVGLHSDSDVTVTNASGYYESKGIGKCGELLCRIGTWTEEPAGYSLACSGTGWAYYTKILGDKCEIIEPPVEPEPIGKITIRFKAPTTWTNASIWAWNMANVAENYTGGAWPGAAMEKDDEGYYSITFDNVSASTLGIVLNDGKKSNAEQTSDLIATGNICWKAGSKSGTYYTVTEDLTCKPVSSIYMVNESFIKISPNPVKDILMISAEKEIQKVDIYNVAGVLVKTSSENRFAVTELVPGLYAAKIVFTDGSHNTSKFIKE